MPLVAAKCMKCGANLQVDSTKETAVCPNCKTQFITEKAINNYNTYNQNNYNIENAEVHIHDEKSVETRLASAEVFLTTHHNIEKAREIFGGVTNDAPADYRGWWGLARANSREFTYIGCGAALFNTIEEEVTCALNVAPPDVCMEIEKTWQGFVQQMNGYKANRQNERATHVARLNAMEVKAKNIQKKLNETDQKINKLANLRCKKERKIWKVKPLQYMIGIAVGIGLFVGFTMLAHSLLLLASMIVTGFYGLCLLRWILIKASINSLRKEIEQQQGICTALSDELRQTNEAISEARNAVQVIDKVLA